MTVATIRWKWLNGMYVYTAVGAGLLGVAMLLAPNLVVAYLGMPIQDPVVFGVVGSAYVAFAIASILGLRFPLRFVPVLMPRRSLLRVYLHDSHASTTTGTRNNGRTGSGWQRDQTGGLQRTDRRESSGLNGLGVGDSLCNYDFL